MCAGAKAFQENTSALYAESRKLIRYDGRVNSVTFLTYLHARAIFVADLTYYYLLLLLLSSSSLLLLSSSSPLRRVFVLIFLRQTMTWKTKLSEIRKWIINLRQIYY